MHSWMGWSHVWVLMGMSVWNATPPSHINTIKLVSYWERNHFSFNECLLFCCPEIILCRNPVEMKKGSTLGTFCGPRPSTLSSRVQMIMISDNMRCSLHKSIDEEELIQGRRGEETVLMRPAPWPLESYLFTYRGNYPHPVEVKSI